jgi:glucose 1-dehydrogenase
MMIQIIAQEVAPHHIRVNSIAPGAIRTPINKLAWDTPAAYNQLLELIPSKRIGEPENIARQSGSPLTMPTPSTVQRCSSTAA